MHTCAIDLPRLALIRDVALQAPRAAKHRARPKPACAAVSKGDSTQGCPTAIRASTSCEIPHPAAYLLLLDERHRGAAVPHAGTKQAKLLVEVLGLPGGLLADRDLDPAHANFFRMNGVNRLSTSFWI